MARPGKTPHAAAQRRRVRQRGSLGVAGTAAISIAAVLAAFVFAYQFVDPAPPDRIVLASGAKGGAYQRYGEAYASYLAARGVDVTLRETAGSAENIKLLEADSGVDVAFVQGGLADTVNSDAVMAIGSLYLEPLWLFVHRDFELEDLKGLAGARLSVGTEGSGVRLVAQRILAAHGVHNESTTFSGVGLAELPQSFADGELDAAFVIADPDAQIISDLLRTSVVKIHSPARVAAYVRRYPYLTRVELPEGVLDLEKNLPREDVSTVAVTAMLVARKDIHPALVDLLLVAAADIHGVPGILADGGDFPTRRYIDLPLSPDADRHFKNGPPFLMRYLPFWTAALVDRLWIMLLPLFGLAIPLVKLVPPAYQWRVRRKLLRLYSELEHLDPRRRGVQSEEDRIDRILSLDELANQTVSASVPAAYKDNLYKLRRDIDLVRRQLLETDTSGND